MKPIPERYRDLIQVEARTRCCFGDLKASIKQYGFHRWVSPNNAAVSPPTNVYLGRMYSLDI